MHVSISLPWMNHACIHNGMSSMCHAPNMYAEYTVWIVHVLSVIDVSCAHHVWIRDVSRVICVSCTYDVSMMYIQCIYHVYMSHVCTSHVCTSLVCLMYFLYIHHISSTYICILDGMFCLDSQASDNIDPISSIYKNTIITCQWNIEATTLKERTMDKSVNVSSQTQTGSNRTSPSKSTTPRQCHHSTFRSIAWHCAELEN